MPSHETPDPKAALEAYKYPEQAADEKTIAIVEAAVKARFPLSYTEGLVEKAADAPIKKSEVEAQKKKYEDRVAQAKKDHPDEIKKEAQEGHTPKLDNGPPAAPKVKEGNGKQTEAKQADKGGKGEGTHHEKGEAKPVAIPPEKVPSPPAAVVLAAPPGSDKELDAWLDGYPNKSKETLEKVSKIKEMSAIAKGFDGQVEGYVKKGDGVGETAKSVAVWFGGKKEINAAFGDNPYEKVGGGLGLLMQLISRIQNVVSIVGNVVGKLGMVLTIVGILAMIVPPIGGAIEAVARVLNTIGVVCDLLGLGLSGVLVGLNGVHLAQMIGKGASPEEKAATADMMMEEANSAGGHIVNLAMVYGPKFMKGFKGASSSIVKKLFSKFKSTVGKFATKIGGPVMNFAKKAAYKMGIGLEKDAAPGLLMRGASAVKNRAVRMGGYVAEKGGKVAGWMGEKAKAAWEAPGKLLERAHDNPVTNYLSKKVGGAAGKIAEKIENNKWIKKINGLGNKFDEMAENAGKKAGASWDKSVQDDVKAMQGAAKTNVAANAANRENARIDHAISKARKNASNSLESAMEGEAVDAAEQTEKYVTQADELEKGRAKSVAQEEKAARNEKANEQNKENREHDREVKKENREHVNEEKEEKELKKELNEDPSFSKNQRKLEKAEDEKKEVKEKLERATSKKNRERLEKEYAQKRHEVEELRQRPAEARGGEAPTTLWGAKEWIGKTSAAVLHGKNEETEKEEERDKAAEEYAGIADHEKEERKEGSEHIAEWAEHEAPAATASEQANAMLEGLDEDLDEDSDEGGADDAGDHELDSADDATDAAPSEPDAKDADAPAAAEPQNSEPAPASVSDEGAGSGSESTPAPAPKPPEGAGDMPELTYWPALAGEKGKFADSAQELTRMKQYAYAFQKAQVEARRKAIESYRAFASASDIEKMNKRTAEAHAKASSVTAKQMDANSESANKGSGEADKAGSAQDKSTSETKGGPPDVPDVGEKPGWSHPIKRCYWYIKKWIAEKAAKVFGWIQEKIASMVLMGLCGVSMGMLKNYTEALRRHMKYGGGVGKAAEGKAGESAAKSDKNDRESADMKHQALYDVQDCDKNIEDANAFVKDVDATEKDLAAEQARATQFIEAYHAAVKAERAKMKEEQEKKKNAAAAQAPAGAPAAAATATAAATPAPAPRRKPAAAKKPPGPPRANPQAAAKIHGAARFVVNQANVVIEQLITSKQQQETQLKDKLERNKNTAADLRPMSAPVMSAPPAQTNSEVVNTAKDHLTTIAGGVQKLTTVDVQLASSARSAASQIRSAAQAIDNAQNAAFQALNKSFKNSYEALAG